MSHPHATTTRLARCAVLFLALVLALGWLTPIAQAGAVAAPALQDGVTATVTGSLVNLRGGPGTGYGVVGRATEGEKLAVTGKNGDGSWLQITVKGKQGWISAALVKTAGAVAGLPVIQVAAAPKAAAQPAPAARAPRARAGFGYGVQAHMVDNDQAGQVMNMTAGMGFRWVKQQVEWRRFEPVQGSMDWGALDNVVNTANATGMNLLFSVVNSPDWARPGGFDASVGGPPANPATFANYVAALAGKYCGSSLKAIEVWNEQNLHYEWGNQDINPAAYMALLKPSYNAIKRACPSMIVVSGALTPTGAPKPWGMDDFAYLEGMYRNGLAQYSDAIGAHPSGFNVPPWATWQQACGAIQQTGNSFSGPCDNPHHSWSFRSTMEGYRNIMVKYRDGAKQVWPTEFGWAAGGAFDSRYGYANDNSYDEQAAWTVEAYRTMRNWGWVGPAFLWNLNFRVVANGSEKAQWGILDAGWGPLPAYHALRDMEK
jgi:SH3-like domain-containing protein